MSKCLNLKHDAAMIQHADRQHLNINTIRTTKPQFAKRVTQPIPNKTTPSLPLQTLWCLAFPPRLPILPELLPAVQENWAQRWILSKHTE